MHSTPVNRILIKHMTVILLKARQKILGPTSNLFRKDLPAFNKFHRGRKSLPKVKKKKRKLNV